MPECIIWVVFYWLGLQVLYKKEIVIDFFNFIVIK
jgi:hypothetical protein